MTDEHLFQTVMLFVLSALLAVALYIGLYSQNQTNGKIAAQSYILEICSQGSDYRQVQACSDAQKQYHLKYVCNNTNSSCWVENK